MPLLRELAGLPASPAAPSLDGLPLHLDGKRVELVKLYEGPDGLWWAMVRPFGFPTAPALHLPMAGLSITPIPAVRAA